MAIDPENFKGSRGIQRQTAIAAAVEEQGVTTAGIARNIRNAALGVQTVSGNITGVSRAAQQTGAAAAEVKTASVALNGRAESLNRQIVSFLDGIRVV
ncbi:MAG: hypothetical protein P4M00_14010 [Azospirillaceae bacterium]|nr:hypothetical protein [Azospirillaceae bacterium]